MHAPCLAAEAARILGVTLANAEIFRRAQLVGKADFKNLEAYITCALLYWGLTVIFSYGLLSLPVA